MRKHFKVDPSLLDEEEFVRLVNQAVWLVHYEQELQAKAIEVGVLKAIGKAFGK